jgi:hypothetical protein
MLYFDSVFRRRKNGGEVLMRVAEGGWMFGFLNHEKLQTKRLKCERCQLVNDLYFALLARSMVAQYFSKNLELEVMICKLQRRLQLWQQSLQKIDRHFQRKRQNNKLLTINYTHLVIYKKNCNGK